DGTQAAEMILQDHELPIVFVSSQERSARSRLDTFVGAPSAMDDVSKGGRVPSNPHPGFAMDLELGTSSMSGWCHLYQVQV
ncbi:MAG: hypothetical protein RBT68_11805, partial [Spirochaetia bacterium]|nr:hypothetical protein [Spirochaetia bacterium]